MEQTDLPPDRPGPTHTVVTDAAGPVADLTLRRRSRTRLAVVVAERGDAAVDLVRDVTTWAPAQFDTELVVVGAADPVVAPELDRVAEHLDALGWQWQAVDRPVGGRAEALDVATAVATGDFLVVPRRGATALGRLPAALGHLWVNGADALVMTPAGAGAAPADGRAAVGRRLAEALGLRVVPAGSPAPTLAVLRRWVARFLLDGLALAVDPGEEFAERVGLLELRLVEVVEPQPAP